MGAHLDCCFNTSSAAPSRGGRARSGSVTPVSETSSQLHLDLEPRTGGVLSPRWTAAVRTTSSRRDPTRNCDVSLLAKTMPAHLLKCGGIYM
jgi:hypothetical protein